MLVLHNWPLLVRGAGRREIVGRRRAWDAVWSPEDVEGRVAGSPLVVAGDPTVGCFVADLQDVS
ncbi:hypothetical protein [Streptomyces sp. WY228]|uniref:hypothetical protein n=1 Tax=Streptomyces sp. WY228 TaxID=2855836 RepID=UPI001C4F4724|nr:hypothetical protein KV381_11945 [Streptomyces sp. WY228]